MIRLASAVVVLSVAACACANTKTPNVAPSQGPVPASRTVEATANVMSFAGSRVRFILPDGFARVSRDVNVVHRNLLISLAVLEMTVTEQDPAPAQVLENLTSIGKNLRDVHRETATRGGARGFQMTGSNDGGAMTVLALTEQHALCAVIVQYPPSSKDVVSAILESVRLQPTATLDPLRLHGLAIDSPNGLEVWDVMGSPIMLKEPGAKTPIPASSPTLAIIVGAYVNASDVDASIDDVLKTSHADLATVQRASVTVDGQPATEITADAVNEGLPVRFYALALVEPHTLVLAYSEPLRSDVATLERIRHVARSLRRVPGALDLVRLSH